MGGSYVDTRKIGVPSDLAAGLSRPCGTLVAVLQLDHHAYAQMVALAYDGLPLEACGLLAGQPGGSGINQAAARCERFYPTDNTARSSRVYTVDAKQHLRAERDADAASMEIIGVMHSHTHTDAYPSPTDIAQAPDPSWHYVIVSLRQESPVCAVTTSPTGRSPRSRWLSSDGD